MSNEAWNPNDHIKQVLADRFANVVTALNKGDRDECKCLMVSGMMTEDDFNNAWPGKQEKITFSRFGKFKCRDYCFDLRSIYSHDPDYYDNLRLEGYMLFIRKRNDNGISYYSPASDVIEPHNFDMLSSNDNWTGIEVPESILEVAETYIFNMYKAELDE